MHVKCIVKKGEYYDSVTLMLIAKKIREEKGIIDSAVVMGSEENKGILNASGLLLNEIKTATDTDLVIVIKGDTEDIVAKGILKAEALLKESRKKGSTQNSIKIKSIEKAIEILSDANLAMISIAGKYAAGEAEKALDKNLHVMLFSDNVPLEEEIRLKKIGVEKGLLVMGPDCGTAIINGIPLAFANVVNIGDIGIVAASGTGLQEVTTMISNLGGGISQAIGTGGRDIKKDVGGIMFIQGLKALIEDSSTKAILLISKPPHESVLEKIANVAKTTKKPIVSTFLGANKKLIESYGIIHSVTLQEGVLKVLALNKTKNENLKKVDEEIIKEENDLKEKAKKEIKKFNKKQKYLRGLFSGGTFASESQLIYDGRLKPLYANAVSGSSLKLKDSNFSEKHTIVDMGEDEFTVGRPHPMIDYSLRNQRIIKEAKDEEVAVILLDMVIGFGSNMTPLEEILPTIKEVKKYLKDNNKFLPIVTSVTGTNKDPQIKSKVFEGLKNEGLYVFDSNASASKFAFYLIEGLN